MADTDRTSVIDWMFRSRETGEVVIAQAPNPPLFVFFAATVAGWVAPADSTTDDVLGWVATGGLAWWAVDEVVRGVNPWRRLLGLGGCGLVAARVMVEIG